MTSRRDCVEVTASSSRDARTGERRLHLRGLHSRTILSVAWSPDGTELALGSRDCTVSVLDTRTGGRRLHLQGLHSRAIYSVEWSPDGTELALGSHDETASVVDARTGRRRLHLEGLHSSAIFSVAWRPCPDPLATVRASTKSQSSSGDGCGSVARSAHADGAAPYSRRIESHDDARSDDPSGAKRSATMSVPRFSP